MVDCAGRVRTTESVMAFSKTCSTAKTTPSSEEATISVNGTDVAHLFCRKENRFGIIFHDFVWCNCVMTRLLFTSLANLYFLTPKQSGRRCGITLNQLER